MPEAPPSIDPDELGAYFALTEVTSLLRHAVERQLRDAGDLSYVQFQLLARLGDAPAGSHRMTDLADGVVYSRSGLTYQAGLLEKAGLVTRAPSSDDERGITVTITDAGRERLAKVFPGHIEVLRHMLLELPPGPDANARGNARLVYIERAWALNDPLHHRLPSIRSTTIAARGSSAIQAML